MEKPKWKVLNVSKWKPRRKGYYSTRIVLAYDKGYGILKERIVDDDTNPDGTLKPPYHQMCDGHYPHESTNLKVAKKWFFDRIKREGYTPIPYTDPTNSQYFWERMHTEILLVLKKIREDMTENPWMCITLTLTDNYGFFLTPYYTPDPSIPALQNPTGETPIADIYEGWRQDFLYNFNSVDNEDGSTEKSFIHSIIHTAETIYSNLLYAGLKIKKAKSDFLYLRNKWGHTLSTFNNEHRARTVLEIYEILRIFQTTEEADPTKRGGFLTKQTVTNGLQITIKDEKGYIVDGELNFFFHGTKPHTYDKQTATIREWEPDEYITTETPEDLDQLTSYELLSLAEKIYDILFKTNMEGEA